MAVGAILPPLFFERCRRPGLGLSFWSLNLGHRARQIQEQPGTRHASSAVRTTDTNQPGRPSPAAEGSVKSMANTSSAKKATRKIARRTIINKSRRTQMRGSVRLVEEALAKGDREAAVKAMGALPSLS